MFARSHDSDYRSVSVLDAARSADVRTATFSLG